MRIEAVYDGDGTIVAAIAFDGDEPHPRPQPGEGQAVGVFDLPADQADRPLDEVCRTMVVDARAGALVERRPPDAP